MCRLDGCRKPARVSGPAPSKYCSDEHGQEFMRQRVLQKSNRGGSSGSNNSDKQAAKRRRPIEADDQAAGTLMSSGAANSASAAAHQAYLRGGHLAPGELKALTDGVKDTIEFKRLGESVLPAIEPTPTATHNNSSHNDHGPSLASATADNCMPEERQQLEDVLSKASALRHRLGVLHDKEHFLGLVKNRASQFSIEVSKASGDVKKKDTGKAICGFDARLSWSDVEFDQWRLSPEGRHALDSSDLGPLPAPLPVQGVRAAAEETDGDVVMQDAAPTEPGDGPGGDATDTICPKRRCERHKTWPKLYQQDIAHDRRECEEEIARLGHAAHGIQERAVLRRLEAGSERGAATPERLASSADAAPPPPAAGPPAALADTTHPILMDVVA